MATRVKLDKMAGTPSLKNIQSLVTTRLGVPEATARTRRKLQRRVERWWAQASRSERVVTVAVVVGGTVAIVNSAAWAIALSYIMRQRAKAAKAARESVKEAAEVAAAAAEELADELEELIEAK